MPDFHSVHITDLTGGGWRAACTCGYDGERQQLVNDSLSASEARGDAVRHARKHAYRVTCPDCRRDVLAFPHANEGGLIMARHTRSMGDPYRPGQQCTSPRVLSADRVRFATPSG